VAGFRRYVRLGSVFGALVLSASLQTFATARAEDARDVAGSEQVPVAGKAVADSAPEPATVPQPPEQSSDDETLLELPIAPAASQPTGSNETGTPDTDPSQAIEALRHDTQGPENLRVLFPAGDAQLDPAAESELLRLAGYLNRHEAQRVVLRGHAADDGQGSSYARRMSLSRALAVRTFLVDSGVPVDRIYLRPLGSESTDGPPDRVDILPLRP
jgi:outer membrane protein OmpA-like peptidoglycan-associated protein